MSVLGNSQLLMTPEGYQISRSVRLRSSASAYFNRTPASAGNRRTWTWSGWVKRGIISSGTHTLFAARNSVVDWQALRISTNDQIEFLQETNVPTRRITSAVYRDPSSWYHIVLAVDTTQATAQNRIRLYVNGVEITAWNTNQTVNQNTDFAINNTVAHSIGRDADGASYFDGYLTEVNFIDGQALTPSSFGEANPVTGVWQPKKYAGTYGTNGFYLNFSDNSAATAAAIGKDYSGNGNNWTPNNISVTAGVTYDSMLDVPTPYADGGNGRGNYATWNPLANQNASNTISDGNLKARTPTGANYRPAKATIGVNTGKWYWEVTPSNDGVPAGGCIGVVLDSIANDYIGSQLGEVSYRGDGQKRVSNVLSAYGSSWGASTDVIGVALDMDAGSITFYKNGVSQGVAASGLTGIYYPAYGDETSIGGGYEGNANFGQRPFAYTPPTGFKALNTQNLPDPTIKKPNQYMDATLWTGDGTSGRAITNAGSFQPDLVWMKVRGQSGNHGLFDAVRGTGKRISSNATWAEDATGGWITAFNSNGFTIDNYNADYNVSGIATVGWQWKAGGTPAVTNTAGSITSTVSANTTSGFSIVTWANVSSSANTIGHGLGIAPSMIIVKHRNDATQQWIVYHKSIGNTGCIFLNLTNATATGIGAWNNTSPTSSVFTVGNSFGSFNCVAYCFAEVAGFSKFGSYTGNGSADGPFVFCGFRPRFIMIKRTDTTNDWEMVDTSRGTYNVNTTVLAANSSSAESGFVSGYELDILSNGFKPRSYGAVHNASGGTYIFAAFAEHPFKNALAR